MIFTPYRRPSAHDFPRGDAATVRETFGDKAGDLRPSRSDHGLDQLRDVFVGDQVVINVSFPVARERFIQFVCAGWLTGASDQAHAEGLAGLARVGPFGAVLGASKLVRVRAVDPLTRGETVTMPLRWEATGPLGRLFPVLDADLVLTATGAETTQLALTGAYRPPLDGLGHGLDRLVLHRAATATIRSLLRSVATALTDQADPPATATTQDIKPSHLR